jgi:hypothetical protein
MYGSLKRRAARAFLPAALMCVAAAAIGSRPSPSWANGDPASDVLLAQDVFYPYEPKVSPTLEKALQKTLYAAARAARLHIKVAIIGSPPELGVVPNLFGRPQSYAQFLEREIAFNQPQALLVVMPAGFGLAAATPQSALAGVPIYSQQRSDGLVHSAILAVAALARANGHPIPIPSTSSSKSSGSPPAALVFGLPAALLALGGLALMLRARSRSPAHRADRERD